jgi:hypothetical protein
MTLALAASHAAPTFNADFYTVAATVIPVLFLAIAVQGTTYDSLIKNAWATPIANPRQWPGLFAALRGFAALLIACLVILGGVQAEIQAVLALYRRSAGGNIPGNVIEGMIALIVITAAGPALSLGKASVAWMRSPAGEETEPDHAARAGQSAPPPSQGTA